VVRRPHKACKFLDNPPHSTEPSLDAHNLPFIPFKRFSDRSLEEDMRPCSIGAILPDTFGRIDTIVFALAHFLPAHIWDFAGLPDLWFGRMTQVHFFRFQEAACGGIGVGFTVHHTLSDELAEGFAFVVGSTSRWPEVGGGEKLGHETGVEEVKYSVFYTADVDVYRKVSFRRG